MFLERLQQHHPKERSGLTQQPRATGGFFLSIRNGASVAEKVNVKFYFISINLHLSSHMWKSKKEGIYVYV